MALLWALVSRPWFFCRDAWCARAQRTVRLALRRLRARASKQAAHRVGFATLHDAMRAGIPAAALTYGETPVCVAYDLLQWAGVGATSHVLDAGAGRGTVLLAARLLGAQATGIEVDADRAGCAALIADTGAVLRCGDARTLLCDDVTHVFLAGTCMDAALRTSIVAKLAPGVCVVSLTHRTIGEQLAARRVWMPWGRVEVFLARIPAIG